MFVQRMRVSSPAGIACVRHPDWPAMLAFGPNHCFSVLHRKIELLNVIDRRMIRDWGLKSSIPVCVEPF